MPTHMMAGDKLNGSIYNEKDQQGTNVLRGVKLRQRDTDGAKGISPQVEMDPESGQVFPLKNLVKATVMRSAYKNNASKSLEISKMEKELLHANDNKISRSQQNDLKVMPGLRRNSKGKVKLDQGPSTRMHGRDRLIDRDSRANDDNVSRKHPLIEENHTLHGDNGRERENPTWRAMKKQRKYIDAYEDEDHNGDQSSEDVLVAEDSTRFGSKDAEVSMPFVDDCVRNQFYCCSKPIDEHVWSIPNETLLVGCIQA
ncbi:hypothetical protein BS78_01G094400 [Paspalum vaginatum]|nr:hypothetical protein BS78_01G094400 [Paspalum vaginatum]KAJ1293772.1 hypothetical protein BS78_01G094400 [Paspalum vaginatum]